MNFKLAFIICTLQVLIVNKILVSHDGNKLQHAMIVEECTEGPMLKIVNNEEYVKLEWTGHEQELNLTLQIVNLLKSSGYLLSTSESNPRNSKGYVYFKQLHNNSQIITQLATYISSLSNIAWTRLRMQDIFQISIHSSHQVCLMNLQYAYPTVSIQHIPNEAQLTHDKHEQLTIGVDRKLQGRGFHQIINYTIQLPAQIDIGITPNQCGIIFTDILPEFTYIDTQQHQNITYHETINIEVPAYRSKQYYYQTTMLFNSAQQVGVRKYLFQQPIHFRYAQPSDQEYTFINLHPLQSIRLQCWSTNPLRVKLIENNTQRGKVRLPVGDTSSASTVSMMSLVISLLGVIVIANTLKRSSD